MGSSCPVVAQRAKSEAQSAKPQILESLDPNIILYQHRGRKLWDFDDKVTEETPEDPPPTDEEWARRVLCSDESCIGVIGADGRCKECGKPYEGELPDVEVLIPETEEVSQSEPEPEENVAGDPEESGEDDDWSRRKLCSDGNCIGVIGFDGTCKECGKPYTGDPT